ncbi:hypothetical protein ANN_24164 [Periplaneta americana]|uniref:Protein kinase domain-containing protein n=1 Tax=Periplaneta americana TaxID=6978 RepID=A0ABQ8S2N2_PERAM|nr:hypothetical protein ANN_24164 [Periplaneta americana]
MIHAEKYTQGIDMWSLGCILAEMFLGKPLFQGTSTINQIELIMATIPSPSEEDLASVCSSYGSQLFQKTPIVPQRTLEEMLCNAPLDGVDLVSKLLVFNPHKRLTADQALEHSYVQRFRCEANEPVLGHAVLPPLRDDVQLSVDEYRNKLYEMMSMGTKSHVRQKVNRDNRSHKCSEHSQIRQLCQPSARTRGVTDGHSKKGRHVSAEMLRVHTIPDSRAFAVPLGHLMPAQSDVNVRGRVMAVPNPQNKRTGILSRGFQHQPVHLPRPNETVQKATGDALHSQQHIEQPRLVRCS